METASALIFGDFDVGINHVDDFFLGFFPGSCAPAVRRDWAAAAEGAVLEEGRHHE